MARSVLSDVFVVVSLVCLVLGSRSWMIWEPSISTGWMHLLTFRLFYRCFVLVILVCSLWTFLIFSAFRFVFFL